VGLDREITRELSMEGDIRGVQSARKEAGFSVRACSKSRILAFKRQNSTLQAPKEPENRDFCGLLTEKNPQFEQALSDRIRLTVHGGESLKAAWDSFGSLAAEETLALETQWAALEGQIPLEAGDETWLVKIEKV
jgi:hypothetical protein